MPFTVAAGGYDPTYGNYVVYVDVSTARVEVRTGGTGRELPWATNNPGALRPGSPGAVGVFHNGAGGAFAIFPDYATGRTAQADNLLTSPYNYGDITITNMVQIWAPPSDNNPTWRTYARHIGEDLDVDPNTTTVNQIRQAGRFGELLDSQQRQEGWHPGTTMQFENGRLVETIGPDGAITQWDHPLVPSIDSVSRLLASGSPISLPPVGDLLKLAFAYLMHDIDNTLHLPGASVTPFLIPKNLLQAVYADYRQSQAVVNSTPSGLPNPGRLQTFGTFTAANGDTISFIYANEILPVTAEDRSHGDPCPLGCPQGALIFVIRGVAHHPDYDQPYNIGTYELSGGCTGWRVSTGGVFGNSSTIVSGGMDLSAANGWQALVQLQRAAFSTFLSGALAVAPSSGQAAVAQNFAVFEANNIPPLSGTALYPWPTGSGDLPTNVLDAAADSRWASIAPAVAKQAAAALGLPLPDAGAAPTLLVNLDAGQAATSGGSPFLNGAWAGPGDGLFVWDPSKLRWRVADAPGETVVGFGLDATLDGRPGNDTLWAGPGDNTLLGGPGDVLHGAGGSEVFVGGQNNLMYAGSGTNTFQIARGFGRDTIYATGGGIDTVQFGPDIEPEDVRVVPRGWTNDLVLEIPTSGDQLTLKGWYETGAAGGPQAVGDSFREHPEFGTRVQQVVFDDSTVWDAATLRRKSLAADAPGETIVGFDTNDTLIGRPGHDELWAGAGNDTLIGGPDDILHGGSGSDVFISGQHNVIDAGSGTNTVKFGRQDGQDILNAGADGITTVDLGTGIKPLDLVFALQPNAAQGEDLRVSIHGSTDDFGRGDDRNKHDDDDGSKHRAISRITVTNWKATGGTSGAPPVVNFETKHAELAGIDVGPLIQAMATFTADTGLSWEQALERRPGAVREILAQYWHASALLDRGDGGDHGDHGHGWSR